MPKTTAAKPAAARKPAAPAAPMRPAAPVRPVAPAPAAVATPEAPAARPGRRPAAPAPAPAAAPARPAPAGPSNAELLSQIAEMKGQIAALTKAASKAKGPLVRTREEILDGAEALVSEDDWRIEPSTYGVALHGATINVKAHSREDSTRTKIGKIVINEEEGSYPVLLAIPRDSDGAYAPTARARGEIAAHHSQREDGTLGGEPDYYTQTELLQIWAD